MCSAGCVLGAQVPVVYPQLMFRTWHQPWWLTLAGWPAGSGCITVAQSCAVMSSWLTSVLHVVSPPTHPRTYVCVHRARAAQAPTRALPAWVRCASAQARCCLSTRCARWVECPCWLTTGASTASTAAHKSASLDHQVCGCAVCLCVVG